MFFGRKILMIYKIVEKNNLRVKVMIIMRIIRRKLFRNLMILLLNFFLVRFLLNFLESVVLNGESSVSMINWKIISMIYFVKLMI